MKAHRELESTKIRQNAYSLMKANPSLIREEGVTVLKEKLAEQDIFLGLLRAGIRRLRAMWHQNGIPRRYPSVCVCDVTGIRIYRRQERWSGRKHCQGEGREKRNVGKGKDGDRKKEEGKRKEREKGRLIKKGGEASLGNRKKNLRGRTQ